MNGEASFLSAVIDLARLFGWRCAHFRAARTATGWRTAVAGDGVGFPDLLLVRRRTGSVIVAELKVGRNICTVEQQQWLEDLEAAGVPAYTWTPADWDEIESVLKDGPCGPSACR